MPDLVKIADALDQALTEVETTDADSAAVRLAREYADALDDGGDLAKLGPQLLAVLTSLGMTPAARKALAKGGSHGTTDSPLDELRERRRQRRAASVDTTATTA